jgi:nucleoside-diphosphate-sugar epimerase
MARVSVEILIVGCGYVGRRVAAAEQTRGNRVSALARSPESAEALRALGIESVRGDLDDPESLVGLDVAGQGVYCFAPPPASGVRDTRMKAFLAAVTPRPPQRIVYISTTGVYGDCHGEWVDEARAPNPTADRARRRLDAEEQLRAFGARTGCGAVILRVPGIYGPDRLPVERLRKGLPLLREDEAPWSNRVHADDLVAACLAAMARGRAGAVYNVSDGHPSTMTDYFRRVADALGLPRPPEISRVESADRPSMACGPRLGPVGEAGDRIDAGMLSYLAESKRIDNRRMREELGVSPRYPTLAEGLAACLASARHGS